MRSQLVFALMIVSVTTSALALTGGDPLLQSNRDCPGSILFHSYQSVDFINYYHIQDDPGTVDGPSNWYVDGNGWLRESSNIYGNGDVFPDLRGTRAYIADECWSDFILQVQVNPHDNDGWGIYFRTSAEDSSATGYRVVFANDLFVGDYLQKSVEGVWITLDANLTPGYLEDQWQLLEIVAIGDELLVKINDTIILNATDATFMEGQIALYSRGMNYLAWDNLLVSNELSGHIDPFVDFVPLFSIQPGNNGNDNDDPTAMIGIPDNNYTSLGGDCAGNPEPAWAVLDMGPGLEVIADGPGYDFEILEVGAVDGGVDEPFEVYVGDTENGPWDFMGIGNSDSYFDLADIGRCTARYIRLNDISTLTWNSGGVPGSDIDGVVAFYLGSSPTLPAPVITEIIVNYSGFETTVNLEWSAVEGATYYNVYRSYDPYDEIDPDFNLLGSTIFTSGVDTIEELYLPYSFYFVTAVICE